MPGQTFAHLLWSNLRKNLPVNIFLIYGSRLRNIVLAHTWQARIRFMVSSRCLSWHGSVTSLRGARVYCVAWGIHVWVRCIALLLTHSKGLRDLSSTLILCHIDASKLQKAAITPCNVRNKLVHRRHDQSMKCVHTVFIASAKPFSIWYIDRLIIYNIPMEQVITV
jgi:hypothetical protein